MPSEKSERILVLCVDRDDDLGAKGKVKGPVIGREKMVDAATKLGLADPADTDFNTMFESVKVYDRMRKDRDVEVACVTGDRDVGIKSDEAISRQLDTVLKEYHATHVLLVTDGAEDEHIIPVITSRLPIISLNRLVVKQAEELESAYFQIKDFVERSLENPKTALIFYGVPSIFLILVSLFDAFGLRIAIFLIGILLAIKGFKPLESYTVAAGQELIYSLAKNRLAFFAYVVAIAFMLLGTFSGYNRALPVSSSGIFHMIAAFISSAVPMYFLGGAIAWLGRGFTLGKSIVSPGKMASIPLFGFALTFVLYNASELILKSEFTLENFFVSIVVGFVFAGAALVFEWKDRR